MEWGNRILLLMLTTFFVSGVSHSFLADTLDPIGFLLQIHLIHPRYPWGEAKNTL